MTRHSAILVGNETLTQQCGEVILSRGHDISCVITHSLDVANWARSKGLHVAAYSDDLGGISADWLLSVANLEVLSRDILARAKLAVNFHDGPLPRYAGLNAPVWAIMNGESHHGITWHVIDAGIDEGDILEQRLFEIAADETALTLNTRCFEVALESFPTLLTQLETGRITRQPQDLAQRSLYRHADRPSNFGHLDFTRNAEEIVRLVRALDHGSYWNPMTTAKISIGNQVLSVRHAEVFAAKAATGEVASQDGTGLVIGCHGGAVRLEGFFSEKIRADVVLASELPHSVDVVEENVGQAALRAAKSEHRLHKLLLDLKPASISTTLGDEDWQSLSLHAALEDLAIAAVHSLGEGSLDLALSSEGLPGYVSHWRPLFVQTNGTVAEARARLDLSWKSGFALDLLSRDKRLSLLTIPQVGLAQDGPLQGTVLTLTPSAIYFDQGRMSRSDAEAFAERLHHVLSAMTSETPVTQISRLTQQERFRVLHQWNETQVAYDSNVCVHEAFERQVALDPAAVALVCDDQSLTYAELNTRANQVAHALINLGVGPGTLVGLYAPRGVELVIGALGIQKAGGAYVPMDPAYPTERIALYIEDSACSVIVSLTETSTRLPPHKAQVLCIDALSKTIPQHSDNPTSGVTSADIAYMIYTSGSTGRPKGVMVEHRNVANFFVGMDDRLGVARGTWLAVTSLSFDISVLELFWTLARGFKVVLTSDENRTLVSGGTLTSSKRMEFSLYYWGNDDGAGPKKYELLLDGARFADTHGFCAVWTPERHFHAFGGPYPNPSVTGAAVAAVTKNIAVRAGSCVMPLHHPARIAEEWAVIDNLTNGRAGIAVASGWHPDDFVLRPENTPPHNKLAMFTAADQVRRLWRGEAVEFPTNNGSHSLQTQPRPVSKELPLWVTTAGNPETWREAGAIGANILTHLLGQSIDEVAGKIKLYHEALRTAGHDPADFKVTLMLHSYLAADRETARETARGPMKDYLRSAAALIKQYAWAFPAFKKPVGVSNPMEIDLQSLSGEETEAILDFAFQRYFEDSGLFGTVEDAIARVEGLKQIGVTEVACLIDYGIAPAKVMEGLIPLAEVLRRSNLATSAANDDFSIAAQILRHNITHLQCTPSMARMIAMNAESQIALAGIETLLLGGEALSSALVSELRQRTSAKILNMYGPTETTIWSSTEEVAPFEGTCNIGRPLVNQRLYVLDNTRNPVPQGVPGELWIGGDGVTRGYWMQPELTAERFVNDPFVKPDAAGAWGARMYRTGDLVRLRQDGKIDFLGRTDHQVKIRGYRIELGEIEAVLEAQSSVTQAVVLAREDSPNDLRLVAYYVGLADEARLREVCASAMPEHMRPAHFVQLNAFPLTPNRKVDRKALPVPSIKSLEKKDFVSPTSSLESSIAAIWSRVLGVQNVGSRDNFFALGGHSLLAVQVHREMKDLLGVPKLSITDIFRYPVLQTLATYLEDAPKPQAQPSDRANVRNDAMARRKMMRAGLNRG